MADSKVPKMLVGVITQHRENDPDFQWLNTLRPQALFNYLVWQFAACSRLKYAIANDPQPFPKCLGCVIGKDEGSQMYQWTNHVFRISVIAARKIRADDDG